MKLKDTATIVTGAASGIGRAIAEACAREGAREPVMAGFITGQTLSVSGGLTMV